MVACMGTKQMSHSNNLFYFTGYYEFENWEVSTVNMNISYIYNSNLNSLHCKSLTFG